MSRRLGRPQLAGRLLAATLALAAVWPAAPASAQSSYRLVITSISTGSFPELSATVAVSDAKDLRVAGLNKSAFSLLENNSPVTVTEVNEEEVGLQAAIVLASSDVFSRRDIDLVTRLDYVKTAITTFVVGDPVTGTQYMKDVMDTVSVFTPEGTLVQNSAVGGEIRNALTAYESEFRADPGQFALIHQALDAVTAAPARPGMKREVIVFTSGIPVASEAEVPPIIERAIANNVTIHTVLVGPEAAPTLPLAQGVEALALGTGGSYRYFQEPASVNPLWDILVSQRVQYRLVYRSALKQSGQYSLQALANVNGASILSPAEDFSVNILPPTIQLVEVPAEIARASDQPGADPAIIDPRQHSFAVQVGFPDGYPRNIAKLQLLVDNTIADERTSGSFDQLMWDLTGYGASASHTVQAYVVDELGLEARTDVRTVLVTVSIPPSVTDQFAPYAMGLTGVAVLVLALAGLLAVTIVVLRRPTVVTNIVREAGARVKEVTEPFIPTPHRGAARNRQGKAYLERVDDAAPGPHPTIELVGDNLRLGRDETLAQITIQDKSVSRLHARITEEADGLFFIHDEGSTSGTWVNFKQVSMSGQQLRHDDVINLGRVQLRFRLRYNDTSATPGEAAPRPDPVRDQTVEHSTEPFQAAITPPRPTHTDTDPGIAPSKHPPEQFHTEAFSPPFTEEKKQKK